MADRSSHDGFRDLGADDPLARLERLVNERTQRMADKPEPAVAGSKVDPKDYDSYEPAEPRLVDDEAEGFQPLALDRLMLRDTLDEPPLDPRLTLPADPIGPVQEAEFDLLPSLAALKAGWDATEGTAPRTSLPEEGASPVGQPIAADTVVTSAPVDAVAAGNDAPAAELDDFDSEINEAVEAALAAANAAIAVTGAQKLEDEVPEPTHPVEVPELPTYEPEARPRAKGSLLSDFEDELPDEMLHIDERGAPADPLSANVRSDLEPNVQDLIRDLTVDKPVANDNGFRRRGIAVAAMLSGVAVIGALSAMTLGGGTEPAEVAVIEAEATEYKIKPAEPGGRAAPNQDNPVYARVAQTEVAKAVEKPETNLFDKSEDVRDVRAPQGVAVAAAKAKGRLGVPEIAPATPEADDIDVSPDTATGSRAPRLVRTIKIDRDDKPKSDPVADILKDAPKPAAPVTPVSPSVVASPAPAPSILPEIGEPTTTAPEADEPTSVAEVGTAAPGIPLPNYRPSAGTAVASARAVGAPSAASSVSDAATAPVESTPTPFVVQIASVPSAADAEASYATLLNRYSSIIAGRGYDVQVADIAGKGTFHRVRIPAVSKADADSMCSKMKAIGGSCFVTR